MLEVPGVSETVRANGPQVREVVVRTEDLEDIWSTSHVWYVRAYHNHLHPREGPSGKPICDAAVTQR